MRYRRSWATSTSLKFLDLRSNQLTGEIPPELRDLVNLVTLYLDTNQLTGEIPPELGNLEDLSLGRNKLKGCVPTNLERQWDDRYGDLRMPFCAK